MYFPDRAATQAVFFNCLSPEEGAAKMEMIGQHSSESFGDELTYAGYRDVPVSYLSCEHDLAMLLEAQQVIILFGSYECES